MEKNERRTDKVDDVIRALPEKFEETKKPTYGKCFKVELSTINMSFFWQERDSFLADKKRQFILRVLTEAWKEPEKYKLFYLLIPKPEWVYGVGEYAEEVCVEEVLNFAHKIGGTTTTLFEEVLGWAQQISNSNGTEIAWDRMCSQGDSIGRPRLVIEEDGKPCSVGGFHSYKINISNTPYNSHMINSSGLPCGNYSSGGMAFSPFPDSSNSHCVKYGGILSPTGIHSEDCWISTYIIPSVTLKTLDAPI